MWSLGVSLLICRVTTNFPYLAIKAGRFTSHCGETGVLHALFFFFLPYLQHRQLLKGCGLEVLTCVSAELGCCTTCGPVGVCELGKVAEITRLFANSHGCFY